MMTSVEVPNEYIESMLDSGWLVWEYVSDGAVMYHESDLRDFGR